MIVSDEKRFVFLHVPKCAGTHIRFQLKKFDTTGNFFWGHGVSADGFELDLMHLTLDEIEQNFSDTYKKILEYSTFCIARNPIPRFFSSYKQYKETNERLILASMTNREIRQDFTEFGKRLLSEDLIGNDPKLVHFNPQTSYTHQNGKRIVKHIFPIENIKEFESFLNSIDVPVDFPSRRDNASYISKGKGSKFVFSVVHGSYQGIKRIVPQVYALRELRRPFVNLLFEKNIEYEKFYDEELFDLVSEFYKKDFDLWTLSSK